MSTTRLIETAFPLRQINRELKPATDAGGREARRHAIRQRLHQAQQMTRFAMLLDAPDNASRSGLSTDDLLSMLVKVSQREDPERPEYQAARNEIEQLLPRRNPVVVANTATGQLFGCQPGFRTIFDNAWIRKSIQAAVPAVRLVYQVPRRQYPYETSLPADGLATETPAQTGEDAPMPDPEVALNRLRREQRLDYPIVFYCAISAGGLIEPDDETLGSRINLHGFDGSPMHEMLERYLISNQFVAMSWTETIQTLVDAGFRIETIWPLRGGVGFQDWMTGRLHRLCLIVCRPASDNSETLSRAQFQQQLTKTIEMAFHRCLTQRIPVLDIPLVMAGDGLQSYSSHRSVLRTDGSRLTVAEAIKLIHLTIDEAMTTIAPTKRQQACPQFADELDGELIRLVDGGLRHDLASQRATLASYSDEHREELLARAYRQYFLYEQRGQAAYALSLSTLIDGWPPAAGTGVREEADQLIESNWESGES